MAVQPPEPPTPPGKGAASSSDTEQILQKLYDLEVRLYKLQVNQLELFKMLRK